MTQEEQDTTEHLQNQQPASSDEVNVLKGRIEQLQAELAQAKEQSLRWQADMSNLMKRKDQEKEQALKYAQVDFFKDFIFLLDSIESALLSSTQPDLSASQMVEGLKMMSEQLYQLLGKFGLSVVMPVIGSPFDPNEAEAMSMQPTIEHPHNAVMMVVQQGYRLNQRLLRPARVIVANNQQGA